MKINGSLYSLFVLQIVPGFEAEICDLLKERFRDALLATYVCFSEYDIIALLSLSSEAPSQPLSIGGPLEISHPAIRDFQQVLCFSWEKSDEISKRDIQDGLAVTFLKLNPGSDLEGVKSEVHALDLVRQKFSDTAGVEARILGTMGVSEVVIWRSGKNLNDLLENIPDATKLSDETEILWSHTIPAIRWEKNDDKIIRKRGSNTASISKSDGFKLAPVKGKIHWTIQISCNPRMAAGVVEQVNKFLLGVHDYGEKDIETRAVFGRRDIEITSKVETSIDLLIGLLELLRTSEGMRGSIISTSTILAYRWIEANQDMRKFSHNNQALYFQRAIGHYVGDIISDIHKAIQDNDHFKNPKISPATELLQSLNRFSALLASPLGEFGEDFFHFIQQLQKEVKDVISESRSPIFSSKLRNRFLYLKHVATTLSYGLEQHMEGAQFGVGSPSQAFTSLNGLGAQRILRAANAIPRSLLHGAGFDPSRWWGFTTFGFRDKTLMLPTGVINLRINDVLSTSEWWSIGHETGHAFNMLIDLYSIAGVPKVIEDLHQSDAYAMCGIDAGELVDELFASVFEYQYCFGGDLDLYLKIVWDFFNSYLEGEEQIERLTEYVFRSVFVYYYHLLRLEYLDIGESIAKLIEKGKQQTHIFDYEVSLDSSLKHRVFGEEHSLKHLIDNGVFRRIFELAPSLVPNLSKVPFNHLVILSELTEPLRDISRQLMGSLQKKSGSIERDVWKNLRAFAKRLNKGELILELDPLDVYLIPSRFMYKVCWRGNRPPLRQESLQRFHSGIGKKPTY